MAEVFISYASADRAHAKLIAKDLSTRGVRLWYDQWDSTVGTKVQSMLEKAIHSSAWFIILFTRNTLRSKWVKQELEIASRLNRQYGTPEIISCVLENTELPQWVTDTVFADFRRDYRVGFTKLLERLIGTEVRNQYQAFQQLDRDRSRAGVLFRQGKYSESKNLYLECLKQFEISRAHIYLNLGLIAFNQYKFEESIKHIRSAYRIFKKEGDLRAETDALQYLTHYYALFGKLKQAKGYLRRLLDRTKGKGIYAWNLMRRGMIDIETGNLTPAWKTLSVSLEYFKKRENRFGVSAVKYLMARVRMCQGKLEEAIDLLNEAMPYSRDANDPKGISYTLLRLAQCFLMKRRFSEAVAHFSELRNVLQKHPDGNVTLEAERLLLSIDLGQCPNKFVSFLKELKKKITDDAKQFAHIRLLRNKIGITDNSTLIEGV